MSKSKDKELSCSTGLEPNKRVDKETYERELALCKKFYKEKGGCGWGRCKTCGVLPLLYKLHKGVLLEGEELEKFRKEVFED